jgi:VPDSG-CTERM motif
MKPRTIAVVIGLSFAICSAAPTQAAPIVGGKIFVQNSGHVIATFLDSYAGFDNLLLLASPPNNHGAIFEVNVTPSGTIVNLGIFNAGTELIFQLNNQNGGIFFTGPANRSPDNLVHAIVDNQFAPGQTFVGFEDIFGGGDLDYNDLQFTLSNVTSAVPDGSSTAMLLGSAVLVLVFLRRFAQR